MSDYGLPDTFGLGDSAIATAISEAVQGQKLASWTSTFRGPIPPFLNLDQGWGTLEIIACVRSDNNALTDQLQLRFNGDAGANYDSVFGRGAGGGVVSSGGAAAATSIRLVDVPGRTATAGLNGSQTITIPRYSTQPAAHAQPVHAVGGFLETEGTIATYFTQTVHGIWRPAVPITELDFFLATGNPALAGSFIDVYGKP